MKLTHVVMLLSAAAALPLPFLSSSLALPPRMEKTVQRSSKAIDARVNELVAAMTLDEKLSLLASDMPMMMAKRPPDALLGAGYTPGVARLRIPSLRMTDASLGVSNLMNMRRDDVATALPSSLSLGSSWNPALARQAGAMIGSEARAKRFNVMLAGGVNLVREPRNGRNFEYPSEDPLLAGAIAGSQIAGVQSAGIVSTVKHFALNAQETGRNVLNVQISEAQARESDLLAFQFAIERGNPGSVMTAYNKVNGDYSSENDWLLNHVLKGDWGYRGWVMSDWGNVHSGPKAALAGLDQQSGKILDKKPWFVKPLRDGVESGELPMARIDDMARRILRSIATAGILDRTDQTVDIDFAAHARVAQAAAEQGIVLLKNDGNLLPIAANARRIVLIGGHADIGVLSGGGSSQVRPVGGPALELKPDPKSLAAQFARKTYTRSSPLAALRARYLDATIDFADGTSPAAAVELARGADLVILFAEEWRTEAEDRPTLSLPDGQDALIAAVAAANPRTVVVLETGGAVSMPWLDQVPAVVQAWYPGQRGGEAIAAILSGDSAPAGRLPISFPASEAQLARPVIDGLASLQTELAKSNKPNYGVAANLTPFDVDYRIDGANIGYKWFATKRMKPLFPFGYGLGYTSFRLDGLRVRGGKTVTASVQVTNTGKRRGVAVPQFYVTLPVRGEQVPRLIGWDRVELAAGESRTVTIVADARLLATYDPASSAWKVAKGNVLVSAGSFAGDDQEKRTVHLNAASLRP